MAADRETPLPALFAGAVRLAYPGRADEEARLAVLRYERYLAEPPQGMDRFGNPLWIHAAPSGSGAERKGWGAAREDARGQAEHADEDEAAALGPSQQHFAGKFFSRPQKFLKAGTEDDRTLHPPGDPRPGFRPARLLRAAVFVTLFAVLYYCFTAVF
jgi:hypothetical protein